MEVVSVKEIDQYCKKCHKSYQDLASHHVNVHRERNKKCPFCVEKRKFSQAPNLRLHIERGHRLEVGQVSTTKKVDEPTTKILGEQLRELVRHYDERTPFLTMNRYVLVDEDSYIIEQPNYVLVYDVERKIAKFTFESKTESCLERKVARHSRKSFNFEPYRPLGMDQMTAKKIRTMGFHVGYLIPVRTNEGSLEDIKATFIFPNAVPMYKTTNTGMWSVCEGLPNKLLTSDSLWKRVHIISGTVLQEGKRALGGSLYHVPVEMFKIFIMENNDGTISRMMCFLIPNQKVYDNIYYHMTNVENIEAKTGIRFTDEAKSIMLTTAADEGFRCTRCHKVFLSRAEYDTHAESHKGLHKCDRCTLEFKNYEELKAHHESRHKLYCCTSCDFKTVKKNELDRHVATHSDERPFGCSVDGCQKSFKTKIKLYEHMTVHTDKRPYRCERCGRRYKTQGSLTRHAKSDHNFTPLRSSLRIVGAAHVSPTASNANDVLSDSSLEEISAERPFSCTRNGCTKSFKTNKDMLTHLQRVHIAGYLKCPHCSHETKYHAKLGAHIRSKHRSLPSSSIKPQTDEDDSSQPKKKTKVTDYFSCQQ